jgi:O-antigen/teichoic acid export membrane protein
VWLRLLNQTDVLIVGSLQNTTEAGVYSAAAKITLLIPMVIIFVNTITAPAIAQLHATGQTVHLQRMLTRVAWGSTVISTPLCMGIVVCSRWLLGLFGPQFESGQVALIILTIGRLVVACTGSVGYLMSMTNHQREAATILGATAVFNIVLCGVLVPMLGIEGAALSTTISMALWSVTMVIAAYRLTGINATVLPVGFFGRR